MKIYFLFVLQNLSRHTMQLVMYVCILYLSQVRFCFKFLSLFEEIVIETFCIIEHNVLNIQLSLK